MTAEERAEKLFFALGAYFWAELHLSGDPENKRLIRAYHVARDDLISLHDQIALERQDAAFAAGDLG